ncbi:MAG: NAD-dependent epimerase/dehydratase family protein [Planctomycetota bacterium]|jgi:UDP-glucose 4-epimerase
MERYLVTGGAGFIGSHIVDALAARGASVTVLDDLSSGSRENLAAAGPSIDLVVGDIRDVSAVDRAMKGAECVIHMAALTSVPESVLAPHRFNDVNAGGTLTILEGARRAGTRRFLLASSCAIYGEAGSEATREPSPAAPMSPYAASKLAAEGYCMAYRHAHGLDGVALRLFNVFGPRQTPDSPYAAVVPKFLETISKGERPVIFGDGGQTRDLVYVEDVAAAFIAVAEAAPSSSAVYNVGAGHSVTVLEILTEASEALGAAMDPEFRAVRPGDIRHSLADVSRIRDEVGFVAATGLRDGMVRTARWMESIGDRKRDE